MLIVQSLANLRETYGADGAAKFMGNCELQLFMAPTDMDTPRYISEAIGDQTRRSRVKSWRQRGWDAATIQERNEGARLIRPEQIRLLGPEAAVALIRDQNPVRLRKVKYYEDRALKRIFAEQDRESLVEPPEVAATPLPGEAAAGVAKAPDGGAGKEPPPSAAALVTTPVPPAPPTPAVVVRGEPSPPTDDAEGGEAATERKLDKLVSDQRGIASEMADLISQARRNLRSNYAPDA